MNVKITDIDGLKPQFIQWEVDRVIYIVGCEPQPVLHFENAELKRAITVEAEAAGYQRWTCRVPNFLLQFPLPMIISVFIQPDEGKVVLTTSFQVQPRKKPMDYTYEENIGYVNWVNKSQEAQEMIDDIQERLDDGDFVGPQGPQGPAGPPGPPTDITLATLTQIDQLF